MEKKLGVGQPIVTTNPMLTNMLSIMQTKEEGGNWLCNNLINIWCNENYTTNYWCDFLYNSAYRFSNFITYKNIDREIIMFKWNDIIQLLSDTENRKSERTEKIRIKMQ